MQTEARQGGTVERQGAQRRGEAGDRVAAGAQVQLKLNPFFRVELGAPTVCELLLEERVVELPDARFVELLMRVREPTGRAELEREAAEVLGVSAQDAAPVIDQLVQAELLVPEGRECAQLPAIRHWVDRGWLDALMFHLRTRNVPFVDDGSTDPQAEARAALGRQPLPEFWKSYPGRAQLELPAPEPFPDEPLSTVLLRRRSNQPWRQPVLPAAWLSAILRAANAEGLQVRRETEAAAAADPAVLLNSSFTALETYLLVFSCDAVPAGLYHYDLRTHGLTLLREGVLREELRTLAIGQERPSKAACVLLLTSRWQRYMFRYRHSRAYRTLLISVAELAQKYILGATAFSLSTFLTPNLIYAHADALLGVDSFEEGTLYAVAIG
ncbi:MAG: SagB/ThcOx family dehydrogenase [Archangiaceae bacterium]|nr:SagB/ThcOx family dehydrogenase [Archangiaceae bacterium]